MTDSSTTTLNFPVTYPSGKVSVDGSGKQYFTLDANGRATAFNGYADPANTANDSNLVTVAYTYDTGGHLVKRLQAYNLYPNSPFEMDYTYSGDQLTQAVWKFGTTVVESVTYTYDGTKPVKNFLDFHPFADEIFYFQSSVNTGIVCNQALVKVVETDYATSLGTTAGVYTSYLNNYVIDANQHVQSFTVSGDAFDTPFAFSFLSIYPSTTYKLSYHCQ
jgi:hypothetical protein